MNLDTLEQLDRQFRDSPAMRAIEVPCNAEIDAASQLLGVPFVEDYREFLLRYGGAIVGPYPVYGLRPVELMEDCRWSVVDVTQQFRCSDCGGVDRWLVFSEDHSGNPIGFDIDGQVWIHDHDFGVSAHQCRAVRWG